MPFNSAPKPGLQPPSEALLDRLQRHRPMRNALLFLISLVLAANCVWAVQGLVAWRRGGELRSSGDEQLLFQRLNATTLSVEVGAAARVARPAAQYLA